MGMRAKEVRVPEMGLSVLALYSVYLRALLVFFVHIPASPNMQRSVTAAMAGQAVGGVIQRLCFRPKKSQPATQV